MQERKQGRGNDGGKPYPFPDLFHIRTYAGIVYLLYAYGKRVSDFKRQPAISHGGSMEAFAEEEILRFKTMDNGVLFMTGSCWEGVDFPGDMVSSLIIVKLPFAVPDPISEAEKETYDSLESYIQSIIVPDMQKKLRQGFGRAIRTETDTCVVSILDIRAVKGGKYHEDVMSALPSCQMAEELREKYRILFVVGKVRVLFVIGKILFPALLLVLIFQTLLGKSLVQFWGLFWRDCWY